MCGCEATVQWFLNPRGLSQLSIQLIVRCTTVEHSTPHRQNRRVHCCALRRNKSTMFHLHPGTEPQHFFALPLNYQSKFSHVLQIATKFLLKTTLSAQTVSVLQWLAIMDRKRAKLIEHIDLGHIIYSRILQVSRVCTINPLGRAC